MSLSITNPKQAIQNYKPWTILEVLQTMNAPSPQEIWKVFGTHQSLESCQREYFIQKILATMNCAVPVPKSPFSFSPASFSMHVCSGNKNGRTFSITTKASCFQEFVLDVALPWIRLLQSVHQAGFVHGNVVLDHFVWDEASHKWFLVDFEHSWLPFPKHSEAAVRLQLESKQVLKWVTEGVGVADSFFFPNMDAFDLFLFNEKPSFLTDYFMLLVCLETFVQKEKKKFSSFELCSLHSVFDSFQQDAQNATCFFPHPFTSPHLNSLIKQLYSLILSPSFL